MAVTTPTIADLTQAKVDGVGVFDVLMQANKAHLEQEFKLGRIKGPEYSTVYLGSLQAVMQTALTFLLEKDKNALQAQLIEQQVLLAQVEVQKAQTELLKVTEEIELVKAQTALAEQQAANLAAEQFNIAKQGAVLEAQAAYIIQQTVNLVSEELLTDAKTAQTTQQTANLVSEELGIDARTALTEQQTLNAVTENTVLVAQECKLRAEYDLLLGQNLKAAQETGLLAQKVVTEQAQTQAMGVDPDSVIGRQKALYSAQTDGFKRDAEQKAAKVLVDTWNTRRVTDEGTVADGTNMLNDVAIGRAINKLLTGVGA